MSRRVQFITPENIEVAYELAGIGSRFVGALIDHLLQLIIILAVSYVASAIAFGLAIAPVLRGRAPFWLEAFIVLATFLVLAGYFIFFELLWAGRTPGKRAVGIRVVRDSGSPVDPYASVVRNFVRLVDFLPPPYGIGLMSVFLSRDYKRLGDFAAGTIVIRERPSAPLERTETTRPSAVAAQFLPLIKDIDALTGPEFQLIHEFVLRRAEMEPAAEQSVAMQLALPLLPRLGIHVAIPVAAHYPEILEAVDRRYAEERGVL